MCLFDEVYVKAFSSFELGFFIIEFLDTLFAYGFYQTCLLKIFSPSLWAESSFLSISFIEQKFSSLTLLSLVDYAFDIISKNNSKSKVIYIFYSAIF